MFNVCRITDFFSSVYGTLKHDRYDDDDDKYILLIFKFHLKRCKQFERTRISSSS